MQPNEQAEILIQRYEYFIQGLHSKEFHRDNYKQIRQTAKDCAIFTATQGQKTSDIRGFNYWSDVIEIITQI